MGPVATWRTTEALGGITQSVDAIAAVGSETDSPAAGNGAGMKS
jgi:hypothetical protein